MPKKKIDRAPWVGFEPSMPVTAVLTAIPTEPQMKLIFKRGLFILFMFWVSFFEAVLGLTWSLSRKTKVTMRFMESNSIYRGMET